METFYLYSLILFFQTQREIGYEGIEVGLDFMDDPDIPEEERADLFLKILKGYGLNDTSQKNGRFEPWLDERPHLDKKPEETPEPKFHECCPTQMVRFSLLNGTLETFVPLN